MILISVGTQLPFQRLVNAVDLWAETRKDVEVIAQIGPDKRHVPHNMQYFDFKPIEEFEVLQRECSLMVSHAGVGSIMKAIEFRKPIIIMPRSHKLREHRNDHQIATAKYFFNLPNVYVARDEFEIMTLLNRHEELVYQSERNSDNLTEMQTNLSALLAQLKPTGRWRRFLQKVGL